MITSLVNRKKIPVLNTALTIEIGIPKIDAEILEQGMAL